MATIPDEYMICYTTWIRKRAISYWPRTHTTRSYKAKSASEGIAVILYKEQDFYAGTQNVHSMINVKIEWKQ